MPGTLRMYVAGVPAPTPRGQVLHDDNLRRACWIATPDPVAPTRAKETKHGGPRDRSAARRGLLWGLGRDPIELLWRFLGTTGQHLI